MDTNLAEILGSETLPTAMLESIQEAFDAKLAESEERIRAEAEAAVREEFSTRFNNDKDALVETMDRMLTDVVKQEIRRSQSELRKVTEARVKLEESLKTSKQQFKTRLRETVDVSNRFITDRLKKAIVEMEQQKKATRAKEAKLESAYTTLKGKMMEQQASRIKKMDDFVVRQVRGELLEFAQDHRALNEKRASLIRESKDKLKQLQTKFVAEAAQKIETAVNSNLKREMTQLHEDIERNRQNSFGRRIFEAIASEYMTSYLAEGTEVRKLQNVLESKDEELSKVKSRLNESQRLIDAASRKERLAEDRATRSRVMSELLGSLSGDKRRTMSQLLESTKTEGLKSAFDRLMPVVLSEGKRAKPATERRAPIMENTRPVERRTVDRSGDKPLRESVDTTYPQDGAISADLRSILHLAGLRE